MSMPKNLSYGPRQAFFYLDTYFLLPEGYADEASFLLQAHQSGEPITVQAFILREDSEAGHDPYELGVCIAPYFIADYLKEPEELFIEFPGEVYPARVELLSQLDYNQRLRQRVTAYCPGCRGFGGVNEKDSSLSGHFEEISLDGFCPYRWETRNSPRNFNNELAYFGSAWGRYNYAALSADDLLDDIKFDLKLSYASGAIVDDREGRTLVLYSKKPTLIQTALTDLLAYCVSEHWENGYRIRLNNRADVNEAAAMALLSEKKLASTRKELSKYGVKLAIMEYDPRGERSMTLFFHTLIDEGLAWLLHAEPGKAICLLTGEYSLMRLRCASPMLEPLGTAVTLYDALKTVRYRISYAMQEAVEDLVSPDAIKDSRLSKKLLKAQEGKVLSRDQVEQLFAYVSGRLGKVPCDHTLHFTELWLKETLPADVFAKAMEEIESMGGYCDCEVLLNCYEDYELV